MTPLRLAVHDYAGHPFQPQLSRRLAAEGHDVLHVYCTRLVAPRGPLGPRPGDAPGLSFLGVDPPGTIAKTKLVRRWLQERAYGRRLVRAVAFFRPQRLLSGNAPLDAQAALLRWCRPRRIRFVYWVQDLLGIGTRTVLAKRWGLPGRLIGAYFRAFEASLLRRSDGCVVITEDFVPILRGYGVPAERIRVIPNWAPVEEFPLRPKDNPWARARGLADRKVALYCGTLGMKHNPELLLALAQALERSVPGALVAVASESHGALWLKREARRRGISNMVFFDFQPYEVLPEVLAAGDVLLSILEADASVFAVPSKVLSAMCAARPIVAAVPAENLAARQIAGAGCGAVVPPHDADAFARAVVRFLQDGPAAEAAGQRARAWAERAFRIDEIAAKFAEVLDLGSAIALSGRRAAVR